MPIDGTCVNRCDALSQPGVDDQAQARDVPLDEIEQMLDEANPWSKVAQRPRDHDPGTHLQRSPGR